MKEVLRSRPRQPHGDTPLVRSLPEFEGFYQRDYEAVAALALAPIVAGPSPIGKPAAASDRILGTACDDRPCVSCSYSLHSVGMTAQTDVIDWLMASDEPWTRHRALLDLEARTPQDPKVVSAHSDMLVHPAVKTLLTRAADWPGYPLQRHNDAAHPLYAIATLADFGLHREDPAIAELAQSVMGHFDGESFETLLWLPRFLTKQADAEAWTWMMCDAPTLVYALLSFGYGSYPDVDRAVSVIAHRVADNGWRCGAAQSLRQFSGPGRKADTCPIATICALKVLSLVPELHDSSAAASGVEAILMHWEHQADYKLKMFGIGTEFRKLKYPFVWHDILHVTDVLSRFPHGRSDPRLHEMVAEVKLQAGKDGRYTATSMYRSWKDWSFADKRAPSPFLTLLALRIEKRIADHAWEPGRCR